MGDLDLFVRRVPPGVVEVTVEGILDANTYEELERLVMDGFDVGEYCYAFELSGLSYLTSAGAGVFIGSISTAQEKGGNLVLMNPRPNVEQVLELLGLTRIFPSARTTGHSLRHFPRLRWDKPAELAVVEA